MGKDFSSIGGVSDNSPATTQAPANFSSIGGIPEAQAQSSSPSWWEQVKSYLSDAHAKTTQLSKDAATMKPQEFTAAHPELGPLYAQPIGAPISAGLAPVAVASGVQKFADAKQAGASTGQAALSGAETAGGVYVGGKLIPKAISAVTNALPAAKTAQAIANFKDVEGKVGEHTVAMTDDIGKALSAMKEGIDTGLNAPSVVNKFVTRIADTDQPPLTYTEARKFYSNMGDLAASESMAANTKMKALVNGLRSSLGDAISTTADQGGKLQQYQDAMKGFAGAKNLEDKIDTAKSYAGKAIGTAILGSAGYAGYAGYRALRDVMGGQ